MILKHKLLNPSTKVLKKQVGISHTKGIHGTLRSLMAYLYNKA